MPDPKNKCHGWDLQVNFVINCFWALWPTLGSSKVLWPGAPFTCTHAYLAYLFSWEQIRPRFGDIWCQFTCRLKKKQSGKITSISNFYKPLLKQHPIFTTNACSKIKNDDEQLKMINFLNGCSLFKNCEGGFQYDIALALNSANLKNLSDGVKYQILTSTPTDYIPKDFKFPPNNERRQCSYKILAKYPFLRYSPSQDGVFCV